LESDPLIKVVFLCSPGNPTGTLLDPKDVLKILEFPKYKGIVFVDEAYIDFKESASLSKWVLAHPNLIVSHTISKAFGLAGARFL
jgi:histidinol-phosphate aminotransferase